MELKDIREIKSPTDHLYHHTATRIINRPSRPIDVLKYHYEFEVAKHYGYSGINEDESFVHVAYCKTLQEAENLAKKLDKGIVLHRTYIDKKQLRKP